MNLHNPLLFLSCSTCSNSILIVIYFLNLSIAHNHILLLLSRERVKRSAKRSVNKELMTKFVAICNWGLRVGWASSPDDVHASDLLFESAAALLL